MRSPHHRVIAGVATAGVLLVACGAEADPLAGPSTETPSSTTTTVATTIAQTTSVASTAPPSENSDPSLAPPATEPATEPAVTEPPLPPPTEPPPAAPPVAAVLGGRALDAASSTSSDIGTNPFPDLVVDDIRRQAKANLRNVFPADRPVLIWMWAPH